MASECLAAYSHSMNDKKHFFKAGYAGFVLGAALLLTTLTGCVGYVDGPRAGVYVAPPMVVVQDDYVYYPDYEVYYSSSRHQYAYLEGGAWISRPAPRGVTVNVLRRSQSVKMDFHDSPANHHAEVVQKYPKKSAPAGSNQGRNDNRNSNQKGDQHDQQGDNHGR
jgi:hypothetical protein